MADEAFALSPINARASLPTDADYDAIHEAFMETSRGRWFLTEFAKRNRNADTRMVLDAVERIEASLASQRQADAQARAEARAELQAQAEAQVDAKPQIDLWPELAKAFTRARIEIAQRLTQEGNEQAFEAIRASVETIRSVSWALRERGFDARICDFLDLQVNAITDGYTGLLAESSVASEVEADVMAAFDTLMEHVEGLTRNDDAETEALDIVVDAVAEAMSEDDDDLVMLPDDDETAVAAAFAEQPAVDVAGPEAAEVASTVEAPPAPHPDAAFHEIYGDDGDIEIVDTAPPEQPAPPPAPTEPEINRQRLYAAKLEPYRSPAANPQLQIITPVDDIEIVDVASAESAPAQPAATAMIDHSTPAAGTAASRSERPKDSAPPAQPSLGQALLASGVVQPGSRPDPLAPFRRMSQAEKIAFFT